MKGKIIMEVDDKGKLKIEVHDFKYNECIRLAAAFITQTLNKIEEESKKIIQEPTNKEVADLGVKNG